MVADTTGGPTAPTSFHSLREKALRGRTDPRQDLGEGIMKEG